MLTPIAVGFFGALIAGPMLAAMAAGLAVGTLLFGFQELVWPNLPDSIRDFFGGAFSWFQRRDPLTLDLDGIESTGVNQSNLILFDHDGDGVKHGTGWISSDDGFLVLDRNSNGRIDSGRELFGDSTQLADGSNAEDGFAALAAEDSNSDGRVDASDARFSQLRVWRDLNQDGVSQSGELFTLQQLGITAINVASVERNQVLANGNQIADVGTYVRSDGTEGAVGETHGTADVDLAENTFYREFPDQVPLAEGVSDLPNMSGSGLVRDLREAASLSTELRGLLEQFSQATTRSQQLSLIDQLLLEWAETAGMDSMEERAGENHYGLRWQQIGSATNEWSGFLHAGGSGGGSGSSGGGIVSQEEMERRAAWGAALARSRDLFTILEAFNGRYFFAMPEDSFAGARTGLAVMQMAHPDESGSGGGGAVTYPVIQLTIAQPQMDALNASYGALRESIYNSLALQTRLQPLIDMIVLAPDPNGTGLVLDFVDLENELQSRVQQDAVNGMADLIEFTRGMSRQLAGTSSNGWGWVEQNIRSVPITPELQALYEEFGVQMASDGVQTIRGSGGSNTLLGAALAENMYGEGGNDGLMGGDGNDYLHGGDGSDSLLGQGGNDGLYGGSGDDILEGGVGNDHLRGETGNDIYIFRRGDGQDTIDNYDTTEGRSDVLRMGPGIGRNDVQLTRSGNDLVVSIRGTTNRVNVSNFFGSDAHTLDGIALADGEYWDLETIRAKVQQGTAGNDHLIAHESGSALYGLGGNDVLEGGAGDDLLEDTSGANVLRGGAGADTFTGLGTFEGGAGDDVINGVGYYSGDTYLFNLGDGRDTINDISYGHLQDTLSFGAGITAASVSLVRSGNDMIFRLSDTDQVTVKNWFVNVSQHGIERVQFAEGGTWDMAALQALAPTAYVGSAAGETINGWEGIDLIDGAGGNDTLNGYGGNDVLAGGAGSDQLSGAEGGDLMQGGDHADSLADYYGNNLFDGGAGNDALTGGSGREIFIGGAGNDVIATGAGADVIAFGRGDGADTIGASVGTDNTVSLGGGIAYSDLSFRRSGNDLVLDVGSGDQLTFQSWYSSTSYRSVVNLQMIAEAMSGFAEGGADPLLDDKVEQFSFLGLVDRFDQARAANPALTSWALSNALLDFHTAGSDSAAIGGDLAYQYGLNRTLAGIGVTPAQTVINDAQFGVSAQSLNALSSLQTGAVRLA